MDNVSSSNPNRSGPVPLAGGGGEPTRPEAAPVSAPPSVSRAPLNLGGGVSTPASPPAPKAPVLRPVPPKPTTGAGAGDRITACKTFFTKLHPGAMHFLDEQITKWLSENPQIVIKHTNVIQGEITEKKIEPNIVIVVWY